MSNTENNPTSAVEPTTVPIHAQAAPLGNKTSLNTIFFLRKQKHLYLNNPKGVCLK
jgi:hypothetical protein